ncbi:hypothetical protein PIIN_08649 [Serendipita indica DSM 11827]|uniref:Uncharacterized protein n=1 Tax=Serendipita indica (strain DSM 11827) TaxID=1109443 RepID=G4U2A3_SERID|nr:hypothetical protein PIIN_08649 [Serendipita indica DSM 11827]
MANLARISRTTSEDSAQQRLTARNRAQTNEMETSLRTRSGHGQQRQQRRARRPRWLNWENVLGVDNATERGRRRLSNPRAIVVVVAVLDLCVCVVGGGSNKVAAGKKGQKDVKPSSMAAAHHHPPPSPKPRRHSVLGHSLFESLQVILEPTYLYWIHALRPYKRL